MPPLHDCLMPVLLPSPCMLLLASPPQQAAVALCHFHLPPLPESLRSSTSMSTVAPLLCRAALCICHLRLRHPSASGSLLWKAMELAGGRSAHTSLVLRTDPARLSGTQPCSCMTKSDHGGCTCTVLAHTSSCVFTEDRPGQAMDLLSYDESTGEWRQPCSSVDPHKKKVERESEPPNRITFYSAACLGSGFSAQLEQSSLYRSLSCYKQGLTHPLFCTNS